MKKMFYRIRRALKQVITDYGAPILIILFWAIIVSLASFFMSGNASEAQQVGKLSANVEQSVRLENEDKLAIPLEKSGEVWNYLQKHYVEDIAGLAALDPKFSSYSSDEYFVDTYFDSSDLQMLKRQSGVRHRQRTNETNPDDRKSGRELVQVKLKDINDNDLVRGELKFQVEYPTRIKSADDAHPLIGLVTRSERERFKETIRGLGLDPYGMKPIVTFEQHRKRVYLLRSEKPFLSFSLDEVTATRFWANISFTELEPELNEITYTEADVVTRKYMEDVNAKIIEEILKTFPYVHRDLTPKYGKVFSHLGNKLGFFKFLMTSF